MPLNFDTSRAPLREQEFGSLVLAVRDAGRGDESHWLEWKSWLDLKSVEARTAVARCVVGLANRQPEVAARFCEGRGYMVIGAAPGSLVGVDEVDPADLTNWWTPYLGHDGPRWNPHWLRVEDRAVLVVEVAAPRPGDLVYAIRKEGPGQGKGTGIRDGDVFVRRAGQTLCDL